MNNILSDQVVSEKNKEKNATAKNAHSSADEVIKICSPPHRILELFI